MNEVKRSLESWISQLQSLQSPIRVLEFVELVLSKMEFEPIFNAFLFSKFVHLAVIHQSMKLHYFNIIKKIKLNKNIQLEFNDFLLEITCQTHKEKYVKLEILEDFNRKWFKLKSNFIKCDNVNLLNSCIVLWEIKQLNDDFIDYKLLELPLQWKFTFLNSTPWMESFKNHLKSLKNCYFNINLKLWIYFFTGVKFHLDKCVSDENLQVLMGSIMEIMALIPLERNERLFLQPFIIQLVDVNYFKFMSNSLCQGILSITCLDSQSELDVIYGSIDSNMWSGNIKILNLIKKNILHRNEYKQRILNLCLDSFMSLEKDSNVTLN